MSVILSGIRDELRGLVSSALNSAMDEGLLPQAEIPAFSIDIPQNTSFGDYAVNAAMVGARTFRKAPPVIAQIIVDKMSLAGTSFERVEIAAGFLNFFLTKNFWPSVVQEVLDKKEAYGRSDFGQGKKVLLEFVSANPTGPMHIGNARGGALGDCLASVMDFAGYTVSREFYVNDAGNQIEKFAVSLASRYMQIFCEGDYAFPEDGYQGEDIKVLAMEFADIHGDFYTKDFDLLKKDIVAYALPKNIAELEENLARYRIVYDKWFRESELYKTGEIKETIALLTEKGLTYEKDDALWYKATECGGEKDEVLVRANGNSTYFAADIAYHRNKFLRGFDLLINVWGADHHGHVSRMKGAMEAIGFDPAGLHIVLMQMVRLLQDGVPIRVSKRTGKSITLVTLLDEVPVDAARLLFNLRDPNMQFDFDLELAVKNSSENPVYYIQYAHARICSILRNLENDSLPSSTSEDLLLLTHPAEKELIRFMARFTDEIAAAAKEYDPSRVTRYVIELAGYFHKFYDSCRVKGVEPNLAAARLSLCEAVRITIANTLRILNVSAPDSM